MITLVRALSVITLILLIAPHALAAETFPGCVMGVAAEVRKVDGGRV